MLRICIAIRSAAFAVVFVASSGSALAQAPSSVQILMPDGTPFYGGTYFPPDDRPNMPSFTRVLG